MATIKVGKDDVELDEEILNVHVDNVNVFLSKYAGMYRYYANKYNDASFIWKRYQDQYASTLNSKFKTYKMHGVEGHNASDKLAEATSKCDEEVLAVQEKMRAAEYVKDHLYHYLKSLDYAHEDATQICYNMRREMDKIGVKTVSRLDTKLGEIFGGDGDK